MEARVNITGTHDAHGKRRVRIDIIPNLPTDQSYNDHHVLVPDEDPPEGLTEEQYQAWYNSVPKHYQTNPCLCHFIDVDEDITQEDLAEMVSNMFSIGTVLAIDDIQHRNYGKGQAGLNEIGNFMRTRRNDAKPLRTVIPNKVLAVVKIGEDPVLIENPEYKARIDEFNERIGSIEIAEF